MLVLIDGVITGKFHINDIYIYIYIYIYIFETNLKRFLC